MNELEQQLAQVDVLSLDVFDTALLRCVDEPIAAFTLVGLHYAHAHPGLPQLAFSAPRRVAEKAARAYVAKTFQRGDVTLDEIYAQAELPRGWSRDDVRDSELAVERVLCVRNPYIHALYTRALAAGKRVAFVSDMYLPAPFIGELLDAAGYRERSSLLVSSAEGGESKGSGQLYARLASHLGVRPDRILHVGDNYAADVTAAHKAGLRAAFYERCAELGRRARWRHPSPHASAMIYRGLVQNHLFAARDAALPLWDRLGYETVGPAWLHYAGKRPQLTAALGASATAFAVLALMVPTDDARGDALVRGADAYARDFERVRLRLPWLTVPAGVALAPFERMQRHPTPAERAELATLDAACARELPPGRVPDDVAL